MWSYIDNPVRITHRSKLIIGLGDSFTEGQGAISPNMWKIFEYNEDIKDTHDLMNLEVKNSWVSQLCYKYIPHYTPINLGVRGSGNRATAKELTFFGNVIDISKASDKIVIFGLAGKERFDFINKNFAKGYNFHTMWPTTPNHDSGFDIGRRNLWSGYEKCIYDDIVGVIEVLMNINEVILWCKVNNAKLVIFSHYDPSITYKNFKNVITSSDYIKGEELLKSLDWNKYFFYPNGYNTMSDYLCELENEPDLIGSHDFYMWCKNDPKRERTYFTPCAHPSIKGHEIIASTLYEHLKDKNYIKNGKNFI